MMRGGDQGNLLLPIFAILHVEGLITQAEYNMIQESMALGKRMDDTGRLLWDIVDDHKRMKLSKEAQL